MNKYRILVSINYDVMQASPRSARLTCRAQVVSVGHLLEGYVLEVKGLWWVVLLLGVNHTWEEGRRSQCHASTVPLERNIAQDGSASVNNRILYIYVCMYILLNSWFTSVRFGFICFNVQSWSNFGVCPQRDLGFWWQFCFMVFFPAQITTAS